MALRADASGDRVGISSAPSGAISIEIEFLGTAYSNQYDALLWMGQSASGANAYDRSLMMVFGNPANNMEIWALDSTAARAGPAAPGGAWLTNTVHKACVTFANTTSGSAINLYADGNPTAIATGTLGSANTYLAQRIEIGNDVNSDNAVDVRQFNVVITNREFSAEEMASRNAMPFMAKARGAWAAWTLFDDSAAGLRDWSGNGRDLTETGTETVHDHDSRTVITGPWGSEDELLGHDAAASSITGTLNATLGALTAAGTGAVDVAGTLARTLAALTSSGAGAVNVDGTLAKTLADLTLDADGTVVDPLGDITGTAAITLAALASAGTGTVNVDGAAAVTLAPVTSAGAGAVTIDGALAKTLGQLIAAGVGDNGDPPPVGGNVGYPPVEWRRRGRR